MINKSYVSVRHQNRRQHNEHFKTDVFPDKFTLCQIKQISKYRKLNLPFTSSIYVVILPLEMQKRLELTKPHVAVFFEASVLKEVHILCVISTITI